MTPMRSAISSGRPSRTCRVAYLHADLWPDAHAVAAHAVGMAALVSNYADDIPSLEVFGKEFTMKVYDIAQAYHYSDMEIRRAMTARRNLPAMKATKAREFVERRIDDIGAYGIPELDVPGLTNHPNVPILTLPTGTWSGASAEDILADMSYMVEQVVTTTNETEVPDTMALPTALYELIAGKVAGSQLNNTVLNIFLQQNPHITTVASWNKLNTAAADGTGRIICYRRSPEVLQLEIPEEFTQKPPQQVNLAAKVITRARIAGVSVRYPLAVAYADNAN